MPAHGHRLCPPGASLHRQSAHDSQSAAYQARSIAGRALIPVPILCSGPLACHRPRSFALQRFSRHRADLFSPFIPFFRSCASVLSGLNWLRGLPCVLFCQLMSLAMRPVARRVCRWVGRIVPVMGGPRLQGALIMGLMGLNLFYACQRPASGAALSLQCVTCCAVLFCANVAGGLCSREYY